MDDNFESSLDKLSEDALKYVGVTNLDFRTHLSKEELKEVQNIIFSVNTLLQITFKDGTEVVDIENIKHLLELSPMCDDKKIEKLILRKNSDEEIKEILSMPYDNPNTWNIAYDIKNDTYMITTLPNYRVMEEYISVVLSCINDDMTTLEKIKEVYDFVKLIEVDNEKSNRLPDIIINRKTDNLGFHILFSEILKRMGINIHIGKIRRDKSVEYITIIDIEDKKYQADGIYAFDPVSDSIPKHTYKSDAIRKVNYNFLALTLKEIVDTKDGDELAGDLEILSSESYDYSIRHIALKDKKNLEMIFDNSYENIFERVKKTKKISDDARLDLILNTIHEDDFLGLNRNVEELLSNNYYLRKKEIFNEPNDENKTISIHDI